MMAPKADDNRKVNKLRTLILGEADWNMGGRIHVNREMMNNAEKHKINPPEHYGGRKKLQSN